MEDAAPPHPEGRGFHREETMKWSQLRGLLGEKPTAHRDDLIIQAFVDGGYLPIRWSAICVQHGGYLGILYVASDALQLGVTGDSCRVNVSHRSAQMIVDRLGLALLTEKVADLIHQQACTIIAPMTDGSSMNVGRGADLSTMEKHNQRVAMGAEKGTGLLSTVGKHWITHNRLLSRPKWAVNFGWHYSGAPYRSRGGLPVWQPASARHNWAHTDYSQVLVPMNCIMLVNGEEMLVEDVMRHPKLSYLLSYDGPMKVTRHPDVPLPAGGTHVLRI